jgi:hypothetical protein
MVDPSQTLAWNNHVSSNDSERPGVEHRTDCLP